MDLYHLDEPKRKVIECCIVSKCVGELFHNISITNGMFMIKIGRILIHDCVLFITTEDDMPPQLTFLNMKHEVTMCS